jgi:protein-disulfide isomerase
MPEEHLSKKELRALKHTEKAEKRAEEARKAKRESFLQNIFIWGFVAILGAGLVLFVGNVLSRDGTGGTSLVFDMPVDVETEWVKGNPDAEVTLIEYADFQCPACAGVIPVVNSLLESYGDEFRFVYRHFPLAFHNNAIPAARASEAAGKQEKFFEMHDLLYENQDEWSSARNPDSIFLGYAEELELDLEAFEVAYESDETLSRIEADRDEAREFAITGTPTFFVNGKLVRFTTSYAPLVEAIETAIAEGQAEDNPSTDEADEVSDDTGVVGE